MKEIVNGIAALFFVFLGLNMLFAGVYRTPRDVSFDHWGPEAVWHGIVFIAFSVLVVYANREDFRR